MHFYHHFLNSGVTVVWCESSKSSSVRDLQGKTHHLYDAHNLRWIEIKFYFKRSDTSLVLYVAAAKAANFEQQNLFYGTFNSEHLHKDVFISKTGHFQFWAHLDPLLLL